MTLSVLDIPDTPAEVGPWLDRHLVGLTLGTLIADLSTVHAKKAMNPPPTLESALGDRLPGVLRGGLRQASRNGISVMLRNPKLLLDLQERLIAGGGPYWVDLAGENSEVTRLAAASLPETLVSGQVRPGSVASPTEDRGRRRNEPNAASTTTHASAVESPPRTPKPPRVGLIRFWARIATIAASMACFLYVVETFDELLAYLDPGGEYHTLVQDTGPPPVVLGEAPWGWNRLSLYTREESPREYFNSLASAAGEWFDVVPFSNEALARRLGTARSGLSQLLLASHQNLPEEEKAWLLEQANEWAELLDEAIRAVESGRPVDEVRANVDEAFSLLIRTLQDKANLGK